MAQSPLTSSVSCGAISELTQDVMTSTKRPVNESSRRQRRITDWKQDAHKQTDIHTQKHTHTDTQTHTHTNMECSCKKSGDTGYTVSRTAVAKYYSTAENQNKCKYDSMWHCYEDNNMLQP